MRLKKSERLGNEPGDRGGGAFTVSVDTRRGAAGYRDLFLHMMDGFAVHEILLAPDGRPCDYRFLDVNPAFERLTGLKASAVVGNTARQVLPNIEAEWIRIYGAVALGGPPTRFEHFNADLSKTFEVTAYCLSPLYFACIFKDITDRRDAEEIHRLDEARLESLVRIAQHRSGNVDDLLEHALQEAIRLTSSLYGYVDIYDDVRQEFISSIWSGTLAEECRIRDPRATHQLRDAGLWAEAVRQRRPVIINEYARHHPGKKGLPEGHAPLTALMSVPVFREGKLVAVIGVANKPSPYDEADARQLALLMDSAWKIVEVARAQDALRESEERFQQAQKMEAVGRLAGGIAHDFNNILTVIGGYCDVASEAAESGKPVAPAVGEIRSATRRAAGLTTQLLTFSRRQVLEVKRINPAELVRGMDGMLRRLLGEDIELSVIGSAETGFVRADRGKLEQVIMNLAVNARDAMPEGGSLTIETANVVLDRDYVSTHTEVCNGDYVLLAVSDTGCGMDAATRRRLFEPFFTTKEPGKGTGLGLATVYGIVRQSEGHIFCYSEPGMGTTFKIYLPRVEEGRGEEKRELPAVAFEPGRGERILLVEDDDMLRTLTATILGQAGYTVRAAASGKDALQSLPSLVDGLDLLITDMVLPGMDGRSLSLAVTARFPAARVLFMSGYTENGIIRRGIAAEGAEFLQKPFTSAAILGKVRAILGTLPTGA